MRDWICRHVVSSSLLPIPPRETGERLGNSPSSERLVLINMIMLRRFWFFRSQAVVLAVLFLSRPLLSSDFVMQVTDSGYLRDHATINIH